MPSPPARLVNKNSVPTLCGYGMKDHVVPSSSRETLIKALTESNVPHDYLPFPNSNHGMYADLDTLQKFIDSSLEYCDRYFNRIVLESGGLLWRLHIRNF